MSSNNWPGHTDQRYIGVIGVRTHHEHRWISQLLQNQHENEVKSNERCPVMTLDKKCILYLMMGMQSSHIC